MSNISAVIGAVVGVFIALLVGLALFGEVADQTAELGEGGSAAVTRTETYAVNATYNFRLLDGTECSYTSVPPWITVLSLTGGGGIATLDGPTVAGTVTCAGTGTGNHDAYLVPDPTGGSFPIGEGAVIIVRTSGNILTSAAATIKQAGGPRTVIVSQASGGNTGSFIAFGVILNILPTVVLVGLLSAGGVIGSFIGRSVGGRMA